MCIDGSERIVDQFFLFFSKFIMVRKPVDIFMILL